MRVSLRGRLYKRKEVNTMTYETPTLGLLGFAVATVLGNSTAQPDNVGDPDPGLGFDATAGLDE